jgi:hypothetical protein
MPDLQPDKRITFTELPKAVVKELAVSVLLPCLRVEALQ